MDALRLGALGRLLRARASIAGHVAHRRRRVSRTSGPPRPTRWQALDDDERPKLCSRESIDALLQGLHRDIADAARCAVEGIAARDFDRLGYPSGIQLSPAERAALVELAMSPYAAEALRKIIADACSRPVFYLLAQLDGHADDWAGADLVERADDEARGDLAERFFEGGATRCDGAVRPTGGGEPLEETLVEVLREDADDRAGRRDG